MFTGFQECCTKTIITLGPSSNNEEILSELFKEGINIVRLNMSHGDHSWHKQNIELIRRVAKERGVNIAIMCDIQGPKVRVGRIAGGSAELIDGSFLSITTEEIEGNGERFSCDHKELAKDVRLGDSVLIDDGTMRLVVREIKGGEIFCEVLNGGTLKPRKGINLPDTHISLPTITEKDRADIEFAIENEVDFLALSFVRNEECVREARKIIGGRLDIPLIPKIETKEALKHIDKILDISDGVLIARGDLGVELPAEEVPFYQNYIIRRAAIKKVPVIVATQMLDSMMHNIRPTRAEVSDVANAVFDGADVLMLSGETAAGKYPLEAFKTLKKIIAYAETTGIVRKVPMEDRNDAPTIVEAIGEAVQRVSENMSAKAIVAYSASGYTARVISKYHIKTPLIGFTHSERVKRRMNMYWGVKAYNVKPVENSDDMIEEVADVLLREESMRKGDIVIITAGLPLSAHANTNFMKIHKL